MRHALLLHPDCRSAAVERVEADVTRSPGGLTVRYFLAGNMSGLKLPLPVGPFRADELWRRACFELFLRADGRNDYCEFNFSPSLEWAAYRFDDYRQGMQPLEIPAPRVEIRQDAESFELQAELDLAGLPEAGRRLGLSAVIEETNTGVLYFALAHAPGKPDFHHADGFTIAIPARHS